MILVCTSICMELSVSGKAISVQIELFLKLNFMLVATFVVSIGFFVIAFKFWMLCLKKYTSAGT